MQVVADGNWLCGWDINWRDVEGELAILDPVGQILCDSNKFMYRGERLGVRTINSRHTVYKKYYELNCTKTLCLSVSSGTVSAFDKKKCILWPSRSHNFSTVLIVLAPKRRAK